VATIKDVYQLDTYADTSGLDKAQGEIKQLGRDIEHTSQAATQASGRVRGLGSSLSGLGGIARGLGGALKGLALGLGALTAGAILGLPRLFNSIRGAMAGAQGTAAGVGKAARQAAGEAAEATRQVSGLFGAWGDVGAGYVMAAGQKAETLSEQAGDLTEAIEDNMERSGEATSRFGTVLDRIGAKWNEFKNIILRALGKALLPLLEKFLEFMEDPATQKFVELLAEDLAEAVVLIADWLMNKAIPAMSEWIKKINEQGGPLQALKTWWENLKTTVLQIIAIILYEILRLTDFIKSNLAIWQGNFQNLKAILTAVVEGIKSLFASLRNTVKSVFDGLILDIKARLNRILEYVNYVIGLYNEIAAKIGLPAIRPIGLLNTGGGEGGYGAEAVAGMTAHAAGVNVGTVIIHANSAAEGQEAANAFVQYLRGAAAAGIRVGV
jgi:hypothetical protein